MTFTNQVSYVLGLYILAKNDIKIYDTLDEKK